MVLRPFNVDHWRVNPTTGMSECASCGLPLWQEATWPHRPGCIYAPPDPTRAFDTQRGNGRRRKDRKK